MSLSYLDKTGLTALWGKVKGLFSKTKPAFINFHSTGNHFWDNDYNVMDGNDWWVFDSITSIDGEVLTNAQFYSTYSNGAPVYLVMNSVVSGNNYYITIPLFSQVDSASGPPSNTLMFRAQWYSSPGATQNDTTIIIWIDDSVDPRVEYIYPTTNESDKNIYDNTLSGLTATNVQDAIDEVITNMPSDADDISYDNTSSGLTATNVQDAIDEVVSSSSTPDADDISYDNTSSGLTATNVQDAIDEVAASSGGGDPQYARGDSVNLEDGIFAGSWYQPKTLFFFIPLPKGTANTGSVSISGKWLVRAGTGGRIIDNVALNTVGSVSVTKKATGVMVRVVLSTASTTYTTDQACTAYGSSSAKITFNT